MIRLIQNELYKIFHKKGLYIIFAITLTLTAIINVIANSDFTDFQDTETSYNHAKQSVAEYEAGGVEYDDFYVNYKVQVLTYELKKENSKYSEKNTPERYYIDTTISALYNRYYYLKNIEKDLNGAALVQPEIDKALETLHNFDWKKDLEDKLKSLEEEQEECKTMECSYDRSEDIVVVKYRIKHGIPYTYKYGSTLLDDYISSYNSYKDEEKDESKITKYSDLYDKRDLEARVAKMKYRLDHDLITNDTEIFEAGPIFVGDMGTIGMMIVICVVLISSAVVADEFNKGTIKQLLVRPYNRYKILVSKLISVFIVTMIFVIFVALGEAIVTGISTNSFGTFLEPQLVYNYNTHSVMAMNVLSKGFLLFACVLPEIMIIILITFFASALFTNNGISTAIGVITYFSASLFNEYINVHKIISYLPLVNWDFSEYLFGGISACKYMSLTKSLTISLITIAVLFILTMILYKHKDIKNQ